MTNAITGTIAKKAEKHGTARTGRAYTLHSFQINGDSKWYRCGFNAIPFKEGESIAFILNEKGEVDPKSVIAAAAPAAPAATTATGGAGKDNYWAAKEERYQAVDVPRMSFSAAQDRAVRLVSAALAADALSFGTVAKGKRLDMLLGYVDQVTDRFFLQSIEAPEHLKVVQERAEAEDSATILGSDNGDYDDE